MPKDVGANLISIREIIVAASHVGRQCGTILGDFLFVASNQGRHVVGGDIAYVDAVFDEVVKSFRIAAHISFNVPPCCDPMEAMLRVFDQKITGTLSAQRRPPRGYHCCIVGEFLLLIGIQFFELQGLKVIILGHVDDPDDDCHKQ